MASVPASAFSLSAATEHLLATGSAGEAIDGFLEDETEQRWGVILSGAGCRTSGFEGTGQGRWVEDAGFPSGAEDLVR